MATPVATLGERLDEALALRNMKPVELARKAGLSESTISHYRSGYAKQPKKDRIMLFASILDVSPSWLMGFNVDIHDTPRELTPHELEIIKRYRQADVETQKFVEYLLKM